VTPASFSVSVPFPSGRPLREKVRSALQFLQAWPVTIDCPLLSQPGRWLSTPPYLCGSDEERSQELATMLKDPAQSVLWCGRGGYGATRLLGQLSQAASGHAWPLTRLLGYSDITALFALVRVQELNVHCVHAPVLTEIPDHPLPEAVIQALQGTPCPLPVEHPGPGMATFEGPIWGGNLAVLASLCGTPWLPNIRQGAIFLEDIEEAPYRLDRFITQLADSGFFATVDRVILGRFTRCGDDKAGLHTARARLEELGVEVLGEVPVGHEAFHLPLFLDRPYRFESSRNCLLPASPASSPPADSQEG
jgi:muramoyltetrapeptide carboxypeptidase